jgi:hypothetical protein
VAWMFVCCDCCVLSGRGLCNGLITRPEESYRLCRVVVCDLETSNTRRLKPANGLRKIQPEWVVTPGKQTNKQILYAFSLSSAAFGRFQAKRSKRSYLGHSFTFVFFRTSDWMIVRSSPIVLLSNPTNYVHINL